MFFALCARVKVKKNDVTDEV